MRKTTNRTPPRYQPTRALPVHAYVPGRDPHRRAPRETMSRSSPRIVGATVVPQRRVPLGRRSVQRRLLLGGARSLGSAVARGATRLAPALLSAGPHSVRGCKRSRLPWATRTRACASPLVPYAGSSACTQSTRIATWASRSRRSSPPSARSSRDRNRANAREAPSSSSRHGLSAAPLGQGDGVPHQHRDGGHPDAAEARRDPAGHCADRLADVG